MLTYSRRRVGISSVALVFALGAAAAYSGTPALIAGRVNAAGNAAPIVVVVVDRAAGKVVHRAYLTDSHAFRVVLAPGKYNFYAFADSNRDGTRDAGEPASVVFSLASPLHAGDRMELPTLTLGRASFVKRDGS